MTEKSTYEEWKKRIAELERQRDVSKETRCQNEERGGEENLRMMFEQALDPMFICDLKGDILDANRSASGLLGYTSKEFSEMKIPDLESPEILNRPWDVIGSGSARNCPVEGLYVHKNGGQVPVQLHTYDYRFRGQDLIFIVARNISRQKKTERDLAYSQIAFEKLIQSLEDFVFVFDSECRIILSNPAVGGRLGYTCDQLNRMKMVDLHPVEQRDEAGRILSEIVSGRTTYCDIPLLAKNGELIEVETKVSEGMLNGEVVYFGISHDVSRRRKMEMRLRQAQKMEAIGNLAGGIAHDFNNILFPILGMAELLIEDLPPDSIQYENATEILKAGKRGRDLITQILAFSRGSDQKKVPIRIQSILKEALRFIRSTLPKNIEIEQKIQQDCGWVMADGTQLYQVAMNLIINAFHAIGRTNGRIFIELKEVDAASGELMRGDHSSKRWVRLTVADNGTGIERTLLDKIFEPYFTTKKDKKGTGLGLSVVYGIVKDLQGDIKVSSEVGEGTVFYVYLPLIPEKVEPSFESDQTMIPGGSERLLLVDDELSVLKTEKQMLERLGYEIFAFSHALEALRAFEKDPEGFDVVITDLTMPTILGDQLAKELKSIRPDIPVLLCTGQANPDEEGDIEKYKDFTMVYKPTLQSELAKIVRQVCDEANEVKKIKKKEALSFDEYKGLVSDL